MDVSLTTLRVIREVAERGSFTAAAVTLGYTQSAISRQIAAAEHEVGVQLFDRVTGGSVSLRPGKCYSGRGSSLSTRWTRPSGN